MPHPQKSVPVSLGERSYRVRVQPGAIETAGQRLREVARGDRCLVVTCRRVARLWGEPLLTSLQAVGFDLTTAFVPEGEGAKCLEQTGRLYDAMIDAKLDRQSLVVSLGGGVVGDLTGFVAATYQRGVDFAQVPTTLLAQVDASVGGKTAINHPRAKNMIGAFHQPRIVLIDPSTLQTLAKRQLRCGMAEVIKHGVILDQRLFRYVEKHVDALVEADLTALTHVIARSCELKAEVVTEDEKETGLRAILNYGHTLGHALESAGAGKWLHGEAVSLGMMGAAYVAEELGMVTGDFVQRQCALLRATGLPVRTQHFDPDDILSRMAHDKKSARGGVRWILPTRCGQVEIVSEVPPEAILGALDRLARER